MIAVSRLQFDVSCGHGKENNLYKALDVSSEHGKENICTRHEILVVVMEKITFLQGVR